MRAFEFDCFQDDQAADASGKRKILESGIKCLDRANEMVSNNSMETVEVEKKGFFTRQWLGARCSEFYYACEAAVVLKSLASLSSSCAGQGPDLAL